MVRVGINGFGRIGRAFFRAVYSEQSRGAGEIEIVGINDLGDAQNLAYLLQYDSVYRAFPHKVRAENGGLTVGDKRVHFSSEKDPAKLPWRELNVDVVIESTGVFESYEKASVHIIAGAKRVVITAPVKDEMEGAATVLMGVNEEKLQTCTITSNASCTTNASSPLIAILDEKIGIEKALLNTTHAYTATQELVDGPVKGTDLRRGRAAAQNITPSSTGAAVAVTKAYEALDKKFDGISLRVPVVAGSIADITFVAKRETTREEVNQILKAAALEERWKGIFDASEEQLVSSDIIGNPHASIADLSMTRVIGNLVKVLGWYDNEMGYAHTLVRHVKAAGSYIKV
ncbi:type I glyceraldehyde-3-phosphate dehydrogenase [Candidatus Adlerbacteria bacterium RIFCSPHIGHO2_12_FULL_53_18]|uniref:Type I glyceraldehyde-3-phosphate dehydrogenase n=2 Tax=Parcubacteria group TaxID=1794811 RepID=A0A1F4XTK2_9BACT|nr:MAG: type I glyceraldehyde-3-phosphate dehydrogenase [Candidatus Adlerbacteria bacterium RIFCSPHIGHO2_12_FULL_53_18]OGG51295.1 MAG: type I glyceraldehyde-3-phosphate dehydrogenase [Candidatus Kaiserbacteria bacterium RIFCSPHIGHO2_01_FULL_54_36b]